MSEMLVTSNTILETANDLARQAAGTAMRFYRNSLDIDLKSDSSPVTLADKTIELEARKLLEERFPDHSILGEEYGAGDLGEKHVWVIDPIDGTRSFITGNPLFGFLLAHVADGVPTVAMISMPATNELFMGQAGQGATLNGVPIETSGKTELADAFVYINEGEKLLVNEPAVLHRLMSAGHTRRFGYDCYPHALLASGCIDAVIDYDLKPFDFLPLAGVIEAAGGVITDWQGFQLGFNSDGRVVSAATPELHAQLLELLAGEGVQ